MRFDWSEEKNDWLKEQRGIGFEEVIACILHNQYLIVTHPNAKDYPHQKAYAVMINEYPYYIPFVETLSGRFLKTIIPSRKLKNLSFPTQL